VNDTQRQQLRLLLTTAPGMTAHPDDPQRLLWQDGASINEVAMLVTGAGWKASTHDFGKLHVGANRGRRITVTRRIRRSSLYLAYLRDGETRVWNVTQQHPLPPGGLQPGNPAEQVGLALLDDLAVPAPSALFHLVDLDRAVTGEYGSRRALLEVTRELTRAG
jgi:hypothetical protein